MREEGLIAKQNYLCCQGCAGSDIVDNLIKMIEKNSAVIEQVKGCCYYHAQDAERKRKGKNFMLRYGNIDTGKYGKIGLSRKSVGNLITKILTRNEIVFEWDGNPNNCIEIIQNKD